MYHICVCTCTIFSKREDCQPFGSTHAEMRRLRMDHRSPGRNRRLSHRSLNAELQAPAAALSAGDSRTAQTPIPLLRIKALFWGKKSTLFSLH